MQMIDDKIAELESLITKQGFDFTLKEETENHFKFTVKLDNFIVMISTPKEEVEVYVVSIFQDKNTIFQDWFYNSLFVPELKDLIQLSRNK